MGGVALRIISTQQNLAKRVQVAAKYPQAHVATKAHIGMIATSAQAISRLQRANRRFNPGMTLTRFTKFDRPCFLLLLALAAAGRRHAWMRKDLGQLLLVLGGGARSF